MHPISHLVPPESVFAAMPHIASRDLAVARWLGIPADHDDIMLTSTFSLPSFEPEWVVFLMRSRSGQHYLEYANAHIQIGSDDENLAVERLSSEIEDNWAHEILTAISTALTAVRYPETDFTMGCDGTDYIFSASHPRSPGLITGQTWSPQTESIPGQLVELAEGMRGYCMCSREFQYRGRARMRSPLDWLQAHQ